MCGIRPSFASWLRRIYASQEGTYWTNTLLPNGAPSWPTSSDDENHDFRFEALEVRLFIDIALLVVSFARQADPTLEWVLSRETFGQKDPRTGHTPLSYLPTLSPGDPHLYPITQVAALAQQILCRVDSKSWVKMWIATPPVGPNSGLLRSHSLRFRWVAPYAGSGLTAPIGRLTRTGSKRRAQ